MIIKLLCSFVLTGVIAVVVGMLYTRFLETQKDTLALRFAAGMLILWAVFQLIAIPCIFGKVGFKEFSWLFGISIIVLVLLSGILNRKNIFSKIREDVVYLSKSPLIMAAAIILLFLQMYVYVRYMHIDEDDAFYVATAVTTDKTNTMYQINAYTGEPYHSFPMRYVLSPFPVFIAFMGRIFGVHPTIMAHTILPVILTALCFCVLYVLGRELFPEDRKKAGYFVVFCQIIQLFSGFNVYQQGMFYLVRIWQGKAVLAAILLPFCFYIGKRLFQQKIQKADWFLSCALMLSCCMVSSMGIMLGAISIGILGILAALYKRSIKTLLLTGLCCVPNMIYAVVYILK